LEEREYKNQRSTAELGAKMSGNEQNSPRGFFGLVSLISECPSSGDESLGLPETAQSRHNDDAGLERCEASGQAGQPNEQSDSAGSLLPDRAKGSDQRRETIRVWVLGLAGLFVILAIIAVDMNNSSPRDAARTSKGPDTANNQGSQPSYAPPRSPARELTFEKPAVGSGNLLTTAQIRWCLREQIRIDTLRDRIVTDDSVIEFNRIVDDYNIRCGSFKYRKGNLEQARREVDAAKDKIAQEILLGDVNLLNRISGPLETHGSPSTPIYKGDIQSKDKLSPSKELTIKKGDGQQDQSVIPKR
jgi:hypothetical protein